MVGGRHLPCNITCHGKVCDVLKGPLSQRGWMLQEHALSRRALFFTEKQTYWECGEGVMCQSMTRMKNQLAMFLGDPNFPNLISKDSQGEKIQRYQKLHVFTRTCR